MALIRWSGFEECGVDGEYLEVADNNLLFRTGIVDRQWGTVDHLCRGGTHARKGQGIALEGHDAGWWRFTNFLSDGVTYIFGVAISTNGDGQIVSIGASNVTSPSSWNIGVARETGQYHFYYSGSSGSVQSTYSWDVPATLLPNSSFCEYQYFEFKFVLGASGSYEFRLDGATVASGSSVDMNEGGSNYIYVGNTNTGNATGTRIDDYYFSDDSGPAPYNDFLGPIHVERLYPSGAGSSTGFTPLSGSNHENVDEEGSGDGDTSYNSTTVAGTKDLFAMNDLQHSNGGTVYSVKQVTQAAKDIAEDNINITPIVKSGSTEVDGTQRPLTTSYDYVTEEYQSNPVTGSAWTESEINNMEAGYKSS